MNGLCKFIVLLIALGIGNVIYKCNVTKPIEIPPPTWWGKGSATNNEDTSIKPFKIDVPQKVLDDLSQRLKNARGFVPPLEGVQHQYGINTNLLKEIVDYWANKYNWRQREKFLNQFDQYKTSIQGLNIHFLHVKPKNVPSNVKILPLLVLHGWPGSVREFYEMIPLLTTVQKDKNFVFEVIAPSLPGYGFSDAAVRPGLGAPQTAVIFKTLMQRLGFDKYYIQGGDWGYAIATHMSVFYPENVKAVHFNMCMSNGLITKIKTLLGALWPSLVIEPEFEKHMYPLSDLFAKILKEFGYMHLQATKPDTIGVALNDSPVGLAAYITEKFIVWTHSSFEQRLDGGLKEKYTYDKILDNIMIYWVTNSITTSMRFYAESINKVNNAFDDTAPILVPTKCAMFKHDLFYQPDHMLKERYTKLIPSGKFDGGHFAAFEVPDVLAKDVWSAVEVFEKQK